MSLQPQNVPIIFTQGLNQKIDSKVVTIPSLLTLENGVFQKSGRINKRHGYEVLGTGIEGSNSKIENGEALGIFQTELNLYDGSKFYSYVPANDLWKEKGNVVSVITSAQSILRNPYQQSNINGAINAGISVYVWEDSRGGVRYSVFNGITNLVQDVELSATAVRPRVVAFENYLIIFYTIAATTELLYRIVATGTPTTISSAVSFTTDMNAVPNYDCVTIGNRIYVSYYDDTSTTSIRYLTNEFDISGATTLAEDSDNFVSLCTDDSENLWVAYSDDTNVRVTVYSFNMVVVLAPTTVEALANIINGTGSVVGSTLTLFYEVEASATYNHYVRKNTITLAGVVGTAADFKRSVGLASKSFINNENVYVNTIHESTFQSTYFTLASAGNVVAKINSEIGGVLINNACLTDVQFSDTYLFANQIKTANVVENSVVYSLKGVNATSFDFSSQNKFQNAELGGLHIVGGIAQFYDGVTVTEEGFSLFPENVSASTYNTGGSLGNGTYEYSVCYEWTDNLGQVHRSAPSVAISVTLATPANKTWTNAEVDTGANTITIASHGFYTGMGFTVTTGGGLPAPLVVATNYFAIVVNANTIKVASSLVNALAGTAIDITTAGSGTSTVVVIAAGTGSAIVTIPTYRATAKSDVSLVVYRTETLGDIFYRTSSVSSPVINSVTTDTKTFTDTNSDATIIANPVLYTTGGVLENIAPPSCSVITVYKNRVFVLTEDGTLWFSKQREEGFPVEFTDAFVITPNTQFGRVKGLSVIDTNFIMLKDSRIETFSGEGPNDLGIGFDYGEPQLVTTVTGCDNPNSIETTPDGLVFKSPKGIFRLNRGLQADYLGAPVEDYNGKLITSSASLSDVNQIRFVTDDDTCMVYDYFFNQWSTFTNHSAQDTAIYNGTFVMLRSNGQVWQENDGFQDQSQPISMRITTSWISFAGLQGFQRIWDMILLGEYKSPHELRVAIGYDFAPNFAQLGTVKPNEVYDIKKWGGETSWGVARSKWGGETPLYNFGNKLTRQKCEALRISFWDNQNYLENFGEGYSINGITLVCGMKKGVNKLQQKQTFSTEAA